MPFMEADVHNRRINVTQTSIRLFRQRETFQTVSRCFSTSERESMILSWGLLCDNLLLVSCRLLVILILCVLRLNTLFASWTVLLPASDCTEIASLLGFICQVKATVDWKFALILSGIVYFLYLSRRKTDRNSLVLNTSWYYEFIPAYLQQTSAYLRQSSSYR